MLKIKQSSTFGKDVKKAVMQGRDIIKILPPLILLATEQQLPAQYKNHPLSGKWAGYFEFHAEFDWLIIYRIVNGFLVLERMGTHDDLFK
ncbi:hypothetical protein AGMMS50276_28430 [Synergistales bacterium]|nr:hypothetical protein AGMMS50276_28430 [Synergistales bacterium]